MNIRTCPSCQAQIIWCRTATGKQMSVDAQPSADGNLYLINGGNADRPPTARSISAGGREPGQPRYVSHAASCRQAAEARRKEPKAALPPVATGRDLFGDGDGAQ